MKRFLITLAVCLFALSATAQPVIKTTTSTPADKPAAAAVVATVPAAPAPVAAPVPAAEPAKVVVPDTVNPPDITKIEEQDPTTFVQKIQAAAKSKEWGILFGFIIMLIVYIVVKFLWKAFPVAWLPWLSITMGVLADVGLDLSAGGKAWWQAILSGLTTGAAASGLWSAVGKKVLGSQTKEKA